MNDQDNYKAPYHDEDSFKNKKSLNQDNSNKKHLQNYLNHQISQSDINGESVGVAAGYGNNSSMMKSVNGGASGLNQYVNGKKTSNSRVVDITPNIQFNENSYISQQNRNDIRKNDKNYACLIIRKMEFFCSKSNLEKHSNYLFRIFDRQEQSFIEAQRNAQIRIKLPDNTKPDILIMFIDYIDKGKEFPNKIDLYIAQNIVTIAEALKMRQIQKKFLMEIIMPMLNRENVIFFIKMSYHKLSDGRGDQDEEGKVDADLESVTTHKEEEDYWLEFLSYTLDLAAANIQYLIKKKSQELHGVLEPNIIDEIIERAIKFYRADLQYDSTLLFETLLKVRNCDSIFQLLDQEKQKIIENEEQILKSGVRPILTWKVQNLSGNFYRESDGFWVENAQWKLAISYFSNDEDALSVSLKMISNPFDVKNSKDYFKKKEFFLPSNVGVYNQNPIDEYEEYDIKDKDEIQQRRKQIEKANAEYPSHSYITMVSAVRIHSNDELKEPLIQSLICSAKSPALLKKFDNFYPEDYDGEVTIEIYFKLKYIYSAILLYITRNFTYQITDPIIYLLPKDQFKLVLKHKLLNVTQEDDVIKSLCLWLEGQEPRDSLDTDLKELLENVQWNYVTIPCFLDLIRNFSIVRRNEAFKKIVHKEFNLRLKFNPEITNLDPPRNCYKYNKTQTNPESITKSLKNAKALLYINHEDFFQKFIDQLLEPIDMIRTHLVNEGVSESSHRKFLEIQLQQKQKELIDIQNQLGNMKLLDEMDNSRSNSRLQRRSSSRQQYNQSRQNGRQSIDEQETVKNSMINLLHVIDGVGTTQQQQQTNGNNLRNISQEIVQQMQFNVNGQVESPFEIYENQVQPGKENKVKILFQSLSMEIKDQEEASKINKNNHKMNYQREGDDDQDDMEDEEEKEEFNVHNQRLNEKSPSPELNFQPLKNNIDSKLLHQQQNHYLKNNDDLASFNCNSFVVGGVALNHQEEVQVHENKEIQTSLNFLITSHMKSRVSNTQLSQDSSIHYMDQAIQMSNPSVKFEFQDLLKEQEEDMKKGQLKPTNNIVKEYVNQSVQFEMTQQDLEHDDDEEIKLDVVNIGLKTENDTNSRSSVLERDLSSKDQQQSTETYDLKVKRAIKFDDNINTSNSFPTETVKTKQHQPNQRPKTQHQMDQNKLLNNNDQQYIKSIQEYTQFVQQLSKDAFDQNFLEQIIGNNEISTPNVFTFQNQDLQVNQNRRSGSSNLQVSQSHQKQLNERIAKHILQSDKSSVFNGNNYHNPASTQAYTPLSNNNQSMMASFFNHPNNGGANYSSSIGSNPNLSGKNFKTPSSVRGAFTSSQVHNNNLEVAKINSSVNSGIQNVSSQPRAKSQNINYRGQKIHEKRVTQAQKVSVQNSKNINLNKTENHIRQTNKSMNGSITRNKSSISNSHSNTGLQSVKNSQLNKYMSNNASQFYSNNISNNNTNRSRLINSKSNNIAGANQTQQIKSSNPVSTKNQNIVSLQKLLENTANITNIENDLMNIPRDLLALTGHSDMNNQSQIHPQNLFNSTIMPDNINLPFDITAQLANYNILDHIQVQSSKPSAIAKQLIINTNTSKINTYNKTQKIPKNPNYQRLLSTGQSPSSNYRNSQNYNVSAFDFQRQNTNGSKTKQNIEFGAKEESKISDLINEDRYTAYFNINNNLNGTQNLIRGNNIGITGGSLNINLASLSSQMSSTHQQQQIINLDHQNERGGLIQ